jgi:CubicO group peptidase (beta-lactamase class C family)
MTHTTLSRRNFVTIGAGALAASLLHVGPARAAAPPWTWYWDTPPAAHEALRQLWTDAGYRPLSITMMGSSSDPRVNMIWVKRTGPAWELGVDLTPDLLDTAVGLYRLFGFRITQLSAVGKLGDPRYALIAEQDGGDPWEQHVLPSLRHAINGADAANDQTIEYWKNWAFANNWIPTSLAIHGSTLDPRYALVLHPNPTNIRWNFDGLNETSAWLVQRHSAQSIMQRARPTRVQVSVDNRYVTLFRDDRVDGSVEMRVDMTQTQLSGVSQSLIALGYYPTQLSATGSGAARRYACIYQQSETILPRSIERQGTGAQKRIDDAMLEIMRNNGIRQGSLAIVNKNRLVYARAFTRAEKGYRLANNEMRFRVASVSKTLTAMLIMKAHLEGLGATGTESLFQRKLQDILNLTKPDGTAPPAVFSSITVAQALTASTTIPRDISHTDVYNEMIKRGATIPATLTAEDMVRCALTMPFRAKSGYSNVAFMVLGLIVEKLYGPKRTFMQVLQQKILTPLGISRIGVFPLTWSQQLANDAWYEHRLLDVIGSYLDPNVLVSGTYGAGDPLPIIAPSGLIGAPADFAKIAAAFSTNEVLHSTDVDLMLNNRYGFDGDDAAVPLDGFKSGGWGGTSAQLSIVKNGFSVCLAFNRDPNDTSLMPNFPSIRQAILNTPASAWSTVDLFPNVHLPAG